VKTLINAWLIWRAARRESTGLMVAAIAVNGGWRAALKAIVIIWFIRALVWIGSGVVLFIFGLPHK